MIGRTIIEQKILDYKAPIKETLNYLFLRHDDVIELTDNLFNNMDKDELGMVFNLDYCTLGYNRTLIGYKWYLKYKNGIVKPDEYFDNFYEGVARILKVFW